VISPTSFDPWVAGQGRVALAAQNARSPKDAAQAFEALLVRQILATARSSSWLSGESETEAGWREMADDALAGHLARVGGLGLAKQIASLLGQSRTERSGKGFEGIVSAPSAAPDGSSLNPLRVPAVTLRSEQAGLPVAPTRFELNPRGFR
jgi:flagellar protein FlgJ